MHGTTQSQNTRATLKPRVDAQYCRDRPDLQLLLITVAFLCRIFTELPIYESLTNHSYIKSLQYYLSHSITFFPYFVNHFVLKQQKTSYVFINKIREKSTFFFSILKVVATNIVFLSSFFYNHISIKVPFNAIPAIKKGLSGQTMIVPVHPERPEK